jgi:amidohydrolase
MIYGTFCIDRGVLFLSLTKERLKEIAIGEIDKNRDNIIAIGDSILSEPELGYKEYKTAEKIKKVFDEIGLSYRDGVGITGVVSEIKGAQSKMKVAVMGELDAVITKAHVLADPETGAAHTCGHNCMIAALAGVSYALGNTDIMKHLDGDVALMAVPAEEYVEIEYRKSLIDEKKVSFPGGKQEFIYLGEFDDVDIAVMQHNSPEVDGFKANGGYISNGFLGKLIRYVGKAVHAGGQPHRGINALNAANIGLMAVHAQRETFMDKDKIRVHPIITKGGDLVNVVPDDVRIETYIRGANVDAILDANAKVDRAFKAGGDAVGAKTEIYTLPGYLPLILCEPLMTLMVENQKQLLGEDKVRFSAEPIAGSTDAGDLSNLMPTLHCVFGGVTGVAHSADYEITDKDVAYIAAAKGLVMTVIDLLYDGAKEGLSIKEGYKATMTKEQYLKDWGKIEE